VQVHSSATRSVLLHRWYSDATAQALTCKRWLSPAAGWLLPLLLCFVALPALGQGTGSIVTPVDDVVSRVVIRASGSSGSGDIGSLRPGEHAELLGSVPSWYHIRASNGMEGFVSKRWTRVLAREDEYFFTIDVIDVGTGLAVLVRGEDFALIYDGGSNDDRRIGAGNRLLAFLQAAAPELVVMDHVILSHPHRDHVELLPDVFANYDVRRVWDAGRGSEICGYRAFITAVRDEPGVSYHTADQDFGTREYAFGRAQCYGQSLPAEVVRLTISSRIDQTPTSLGRGATMTVLYADAARHSNANENSLVVRLDLGSRRILFMGDAEAGGRQHPSAAPSGRSIEGILLACCVSDIAADVLIVGHHGSMTSSRSAFLDAMQASIYVVSSGPFPYGAVVLPDTAVINELGRRGQVLRTDLNDAVCGARAVKIGATNDGRPGGCDNIRIRVSSRGAVSAAYWQPDQF
jgi:beta-lactamase superfamily II metal-dependent hydrolase